MNDPIIDRAKWPVPENMKGYSARDVFIWYICQTWPLFFGGDEKIEVVLDHDFGLSILKRGKWQLELRNLEEFPVNHE